MITFHAFGPMWGLPDPSGFVMKTEVQLKMAGLTYETQYGALDRAPKSKLPFIIDDGVTVADSVYIRDHIEKKYGIDFDAGLAPAQRAQAWAIERMLEDHLYWAIVYARWSGDANFGKGPADFFAGAPDEVREGGRQHMLASLHGQGFGRHDDATVGDLARRSFAALSQALGEGPCLFGREMSGVDATAFAMVASALCPRFDSEVRTAVEAFPNLIAYSERMMARFYPEMASASSTRLTHA